jgi:hypothetical protein
VNPIHRKTILIGFVAALALGACASAPRSPASAAPELIASDVPDAGRMSGIVINRSYGDFFVVKGKEVRRRIELAWDYDRGTAMRRTYDTAGKLLLTEDVPGAEMRLTPIEDERLKALVSGYPTLKDVVKQPGVVIWGGGFVMRKPGDRYCDRGTRCIYAILSKDGGFTPIVRAIVDLQRDRVVYPDYDAASRQDIAKPSMGNK